MHAKNLIILLLLLLFIGCAATDTNTTPTRFARPVSTQSAQGQASAGSNSSTTTPNTPDPPTPMPAGIKPLGVRGDLPPLALKDWPRLPDDNGLGLHFIASGYYTEDELNREIARMTSMHLKWALVLYADENMLDLAARKFKAAGIQVVWRKAIRAYETYFGWERDIKVLSQDGMPPYFQLYNEPELGTEWEGRKQDMDQFMTNLAKAARDVYNNGGYPGIQFLAADNLTRFIDYVHAAKGDALFGRMFFIPHAYGMNHPPTYTEDTVSVLSFEQYAQVFQQKIGFVPPFIIGEGGWKVGSTDDNRFPKVDETLHRDYTMAVFDWFRTGKLSDGKPLPDYLFAFCHWMISGKLEAGAWFDSFNGDRTLTIQAAQQLAPFTRKFSWSK